MFHPHFSIFSPCAFFHPRRYPSIPRSIKIRLWRLWLYGVVQRSICRIQNGGRVLSGNCTVIFRVFWYKITFMLRIVRRYVNKTCKALSFCRYEHSSPVRSSLKWEETQFNGVEVNLSQLEDNPNLDEFSRRLKGKFTFWKRTRLEIIVNYMAPIAFNLMLL